MVLLVRLLTLGQKVEEKGGLEGQFVGDNQPFPKYQVVFGNKQLLQV
jgi:hypothetical protein